MMFSYCTNCRYGEFLYSHLLIFAPTVEELGGALSVEAVVEFIDEGGKSLSCPVVLTGDHFVISLKADILVLANVKSYGQVMS